MPMRLLYGFPTARVMPTVGALLLGMYDDKGVLHHIGHTSLFTAKQKKELVEKLKPFEGGTSSRAG